MHEPSEGQVAGRKFCFVRGGKYILYICILKTENTLGQLILGLPALQFLSLSLAAVILSFRFYFPSSFFFGNFCGFQSGCPLLREELGRHSATSGECQERKALGMQLVSLLHEIMKRLTETSKTERGNAHIKKRKTEKKMGIKAPPPQSAGKLIKRLAYLKTFATHRSSTCAPDAV